MYDGTLRTQYEWVDGDRAMTIEVETFVSRRDWALAVVQVQITPHFAGAVKVRLPLRAPPPPKRSPLEKLEKLEGEAARNQWALWYPGYMAPRQSSAQLRAGEALLQMLSSAEGEKTLVAEAVDVDWPGGLDSKQAVRQQSNDASGVELSFSARAGSAYVFHKYAAIVSGSNASELSEKAAAKARQSRARGYAVLVRDHAAAWHELWETDIQVEGDPQLQTVIHSMIFYLLGSASGDSSFSIPPMGLSTAGYYGHVFWDADTFMFPVLMALHPEMAKPLVTFRNHTLERARLNAQRNQRSGAMYPWEADRDGDEATPRFAYQNALYENHVNGDVALAQWQYFLATGDRKWLEDSGYPVIRDTADFWISRVTWNGAKNRYQIGNVVSVDESKIGITDDPYTNASAKKNLLLAVAAAKVLGKTVNPKWTEIAQKLYQPRQDVLLLDYPLEFSLSDQSRRSILKAAEAKAAGRQEGVMMEIEFYPALAAEVGDRAVMRKMLDNTWRPYVRPPFNVLPETPTNANINFLTGAAAFLHQFVFGYSGLRFSEDGGLVRKYKPMLPPGIKKLTLHNLSVRGRRVDISIP